MSTSTDPLGASSQPVLLATGDPGLRAGVQRLAAAAGVGVELCAADPPSLSWRAAALVLVGSDLVETVAGAAWPPRPDLLVVTHGGSGPEENLFRAALTIGARGVLELPGDDADLQELLTDAADRPAGSRRARVIGVVAGNGGAGATTVAAAVSEAAAQEGACLAVDLDPWSGGLDRVLGLEGAEGLRWDSLHGIDGRLGAGVLHDAVARRDQLGVLAWSSPTDLTAGSPRVGPDAAMVRTVLTAAARGHHHVVLDLPRAMSPAVQEAVPRCDLVVVVGTRTVAAAAATHRVATTFGLHARDLVLVSRGGSRGLRGEQVSAALGVPLLAEVPDLRRLTEVIDLGGGPLRAGGRPLARVAGLVLERAQAVQAAQVA